MSRSERYIPPSDEEIQAHLRSVETAKRFDDLRDKIVRAKLRRIKKSDLVELTIRIAKEAKATAWLLEHEIELDKPVDLLVHDIQAAINIATRVDELRLNYNFDFDWHAYDAVRRGLSQLIQKGRIEEAQALALTLIAKGSRQVECSDEGLMQEEIVSCLRPVIAAASEASGGSKWAREMLAHDGVQFLCRQELTALAGQIHGE